MAGCVHQCETVKGEELKQKCYFVQLVEGFLNGFSSSDCFRPLPPRLGNGDCVDLLKLYFAVKHKGGFEAISGKNLWGEVSLQCGFGLGFRSAFKLIYDKYLSSLESWLVRLEKEEGFESDLLMELERDYRDYVAKSVGGKRESDGSCGYKLDKSGISFIDLTDEDDENENESRSEKLDWKKLVTDFGDSEGSNVGNDESVKLEQVNAKPCFVRTEQSAVKLKHEKRGMSLRDAGDSTEGDGESVDLKQPKIIKGFVIDENNIVYNRGYENVKQVKSEMSAIHGNSSEGSDDKRFSATPVVAGNVVKSSENSIASKKSNEYITNVDSGVSKEVSSRKRKRDCLLSVMLGWMANVAKNPIDRVIGEIPELSEWASYGNDNIWKQALLARQALYSRKFRKGITKNGCQVKLHTLLDENDKLSTRTTYQTKANSIRPRQRLEARLDMQPTSSIYTSRPQQRIPIGNDFQVQVPEWTGKTIQSDPKWLGTQTWPLEKTEKRPFIEYDPLGKGRADSCGCQYRDSTDCVKFHVSERRMKTRFELGSAFYAWKFDKMGEESSVSWTIDEEKKFRSIVKENPQSSLKCFWESMREALPKKRWIDQVNYYYNVFMLRRRGYQNRHYPSDIDSGDDETEYRSTNNSIKHGSA